jgi:hypothetical protein
MFKAVAGVALAVTASVAIADALATRPAPGAPSVRPRVMVALAPSVVSVNWERFPSHSDIDRLSPPFARKHRIDGHAMLNCRVDAAGYLNACAVAQVEPAGIGFDDAALRLAPYFKLDTRLSDGRAMRPGQVSVPILFGAPPS